ncbi:MAG: hypothetical protein LUD50_05005 [Clostridia bacterium]|nr:hypothetical protein [Clostridia bacterium]
MPTSSLFHIVVLDDEGMKILAEKLKELEETEIPDEDEDTDSPCLTYREVCEYLKDVDEIGP